MRTRRFGYPCLMFLASFASPAWSQDSKPEKESPPPPNCADVSAVVDAHNHERKLADLPPLTVDAKLEAAALVQARDMAKHEKMSHEGSDGSTPAQRIEGQKYHYRGLGENVAMGQPGVKEVMRSWLNSPPHKKNILGDFSQIGVACVKAEDGEPYWCVDFGKPWPELAPDVAVSSLLKELNRVRADKDKPKLKINKKLQDAAARHAHAMASQGPEGAYRSKDDEGQTPFQRLEEAGYRYRRLGELLAFGQATPEEAVKSWVDDPKNRDSILGDFSEVGIGYATSEKGIPFWCILIAKPLR